MRINLKTKYFCELAPITREDRKFFGSALYGRGSWTIIRYTDISGNIWDYILF